MSVLTSMIAVVSPKWAAQRRRAEAALAVMDEWDGASRRKRSMRGWSAPVRPASKVNESVMGTLSPRQQILGRTRELMRRNPMARGSLKTMGTYIVGSGLSLQMRVDGAALGWSDEQVEKFQSSVEARYEAWCLGKNCDIRRTQNFYGLQRLITRYFLRDGEVLFQLPIMKYGTRKEISVQVVDPIRLSNPDNKSNDINDGKSLVSGIELNAYGAPVKYHISDTIDNRTSWSSVPAFDAKDRRQMFHIYDPEYVDEARGISMFATVLEHFHMLDKYTDSELMAAVVSSYFTVFVSSKSGASLPALAFDDEGEGGESDDPRELKLGHGAVIETDGETTVSTANPGRPNDKFDPFVEAILRQIGVSLGLPFEMLIKHFRSSYSAARAALLDGWKYLSTVRDFIATEFCQPVFERWMDYEVAQGRIDAPGYFDDPVKRAAYLRCVWVGDGPGSLDPVKEATAREIDLRTGVLDLDEACMAATGSSYLEKHKKMVKIAKLRREAGLTVPGGAIVPAAPEKDGPETPIEDTPNQEE